MQQALQVDGVFFVNQLWHIVLRRLMLPLILSYLHCAMHFQSDQPMWSKADVGYISLS